eukprot:TRINITY_DN4553_c0_g1_i1.p1 TRINITY_DN4553_c0_g1~~TRINITY_DN4553_c0_g1_i1.p1  ORF type:complete len:258 (+),score=9.63 TRINITY_DN4553_c0_g1_i1:347-1120(+)
MWSFSSNSVSGTNNKSSSICSDDEASYRKSVEERLECPICWESFNIVENVPYVLWCGHTLCKNCVLALQWAIVRFPTLPVQLPLFISCPWCQLLSFRLVWKGNLRFPRKNFFLLWMVESMNDERRVHGSLCGGDQGCGQHSESTSEFSTGSSTGEHVQVAAENRSNWRNRLINMYRNHLNPNMLHASFRKSLIIFVQMTAKFPLVIIFLLIVLYVIPASAAILALYCIITVLFAIPSFLILYFSYPSLEWLVREIVT